MTVGFCNFEHGFSTFTRAWFSEPRLTYTVFFSGLLYLHSKSLHAEWLYDKQQTSFFTH